MVRAIDDYFPQIQHDVPDLALAEPKPHAYAPLDESIHEVRLVCLWPGSDNDHIQCQMAHVPLYAGLNFEALSYTWGSPENPVTILLDGCPFSIGPNLFGALRALRHSSKPRFLWIDALCINQASIEERSREVQRMRDIYRKAFDVVVWLGEAADGSDDAMDLIASSVPDRIPQITFHNTDSRWSALDKLVRRPWWNRVWCLQELAVALWGPTIACGSKRVSWMQCFDTCRKLPLYWHQQGLSAGEYYVYPDQKLTYKEHWAIRNQYPSQQLVLGFLLTRTLSWEATDPRDKIFGIVGLSCQEDREAIVPDYSLSTREVYKRTARHLAKKNLHCLYSNTNSSRSDIFGSQRLPSWVSDWSLGSARQPPLWEQGCYGASSPNPSTQSRMKPALDESEDDDVLRLGGWYVDTIEELFEPIVTDEGWTDDDRSGLLQTIRSVETFLHRCIGSKGGSESDADTFIDPDRGEMLWRTLISDKEFTQYSWTSPASHLFGKAYEALRSEAWEHGQPRQADDHSSKEEDAAEAVAENDKCVEGEKSTPPEELGPFISRYIAFAKYTLESRRIFVTKRGFFGISSNEISKDDFVIILAGGDMPFVLRDEEFCQKHEHCRLRLISEAYVYGAMDGNLVRFLPRMMFNIF
jgi:hypothetical protein